MTLDISSFKASPKFNRFAPVFMPMASAIAGCPLKRISVVGGST